METHQAILNHLQQIAANFHHPNYTHITTELTPNTLTIRYTTRHEHHLHTRTTTIYYDQQTHHFYIYNPIYTYRSYHNQTQTTFDITNPNLLEQLEQLITNATT